jgi:hypothetical protein
LNALLGFLAFSENDFIVLFILFLLLTRALPRLESLNHGGTRATLNLHYGNPACRGHNEKGDSKKLKPLRTNQRF